MEENEKFWDSLSELWMSTDLPVPDSLGGDFNVVEEPIDRLPHRSDARDTTAALARFKRLLDLKDGWRAINPDTKDYTFTSNHHSMTLSRIDRFYASPAVLKHSRHWSISDAAGGLTDHRMVSFQLSAPGSPYIGKGRYTMPLFLLRDKELIDFVIKKGCELELKINTSPDDMVAIQTDFKAFKDDILNFARRRAKEAIGALEESKQKLQREKIATLNGPAPPAVPDADPPHLNPDPDPLTPAPDEGGPPDTGTTTAEKAAAIQQAINDITERQRERKRTETRIRCHTELDRITKFSVRMSKESKPRDTIEYLQRTDTNPAQGSKRSSEMAEIARDYHNDLQFDETEIDHDAKDAAITAALVGLSSHEDDPEMQILSQPLTEADVLTALLQAASGTAAGMDGVPTELWKKLHELYLESLRANKAANGPQRPVFNVVKVLTQVYNSIEKHGVVTGTQFATGWMCPIWKKKDPSDIANYRPITVLNTDYKIFTKALANKLSRIAPTLIHRDQAGFMKGRKIADQIYLAMETLEYAEEDLKNGAVVALDQEKAYDKTSHRYL
jgi:hypothetical protein